MFLNAMFAHGYMPDKLMQSVIIPIVKKKKGDITNMDNYRPIAIVTFVVCVQLAPNSDVGTAF